MDFHTAVLAHLGRLACSDDKAAAAFQELCNLPHRERYARIQLAILTTRANRACPEVACDYFIGK